ncbi:hypothetical protein AMJ39_08590 [candidate division TA06 bacterium DG_24]|uniref:Calcineurin-like phosphoesterase domain-containing protein n=3 Tax=Bacteria division TA06 TaxID=1156500 RepID=A0A0S8JRT1_UNCT6|nr:MAG: hypothetical protein AMJ39_08590 [candidate division TA06 bacterium DG_24]KPK68325.1 MAG: hypothetical protein AMJ82_08565 [candidate division TA06 bacterium SM23_40]KPL11374.1 MAG: hypothetical protein AMJ71_01005 [candidate division TA06 bacterium SM1_40]
MKIHRATSGTWPTAMRFLVAVHLLGMACLLALSGSALGASRGEDFQFAVLSDRTGSAVPGIFEAVIEEVARLNPDLVMSVGDYIEGYVDDAAAVNAEYDEFFELLEPLTVPYYLVPGNHEIWSDLSGEIWDKRVGRRYYSFDYEGCHFIFLDTSTIDQSEDMDEAQLKWLEKDLKKYRKAKLTFVFFHKPFWFEAMRAGRDDVLHTLFKEFGVDYVFTGHYHVYCAAEWDGIHYYITGSSGGSFGEPSEERGRFFGYMWVTVEDDEVDVALIKLGNVLESDYVAFRDLQQIAQIETTGVVVSQLSTQENIEEIGGPIQVSLTSLWGASLEGMIAWDTRAWVVEPESRAYNVGPDEKVSLPFAVELDDRENIYPLPSFEITYPYGDGKKLTLEVPLELVRVAISPTLKTAPKIDGLLENDVWDDLVPITVFGSPDGERRGTETLRFYFGHHDEHLYLATWCRESSVGELVANTTADERDGPLWQEDCVEYFFDTDYDRKSYVQLFIGPQGGVFDQLCYVTPEHYEFDQGWNGGWEVATHVGEDFWTTETAIAVPELDVEHAFGRPEGEAEARPVIRRGPRMQLGELWGMNLRRKQPRVQSNADWQPPFAHDPTSFGRLIFE